MGLPAPMADAVWAILLDLALDAVAIRLGLWTWTIRANQGWFGVPWGNFFAWLFVAFWFSFFTRLVRARSVVRGGTGTGWQWLVPIVSFSALVGTLVPFVAVENTSALPIFPHDGSGAQSYHNGVWIGFAIALAIFGVGAGLGLMRRSAGREAPDEWLQLVRLVIHVLFLGALIMGGLYLDAPLLLVVAAALFGVELVATTYWFPEWKDSFRRWLPAKRNEEATAKRS